MSSVHEDYGRGWHRPWIVLLVVFIPITAAHVLLHDGIEAAQVICQQNAKGRFRAAVAIGGLVWKADLHAALDCARRHDRRVLLAFHAEFTDVWAKSNKSYIFREASVQSALKRYLLVMLSTDWVPDECYRHVATTDEKLTHADANLAFEQRAFFTVQEPYYVILQPMSDGRITVVATYEEAKINDIPRFLRFLRDHF